MTFDEARDRAKNAAMFDLQYLYHGSKEMVLEPTFRETEHCWMFFRNRSIYMPPEAALAKFAYVFGKNGGGRSVADLWDDPVELEKYLELLSSYFATHTE